MWWVTTRQSGCAGPMASRRLRKSCGSPRTAMSPSSRPTRGTERRWPSSAAPSPRAACLCHRAPAGQDFQGTVSSGIVSANRVIDGLRYIQSDVSVSPGSSGGALLDETGSVIGITVSGVQVGGPAGLNLFIPIGDAMDFLSWNSTDGCCQRAGASSAGDGAADRRPSDAGTPRRGEGVSLGTAVHHQLRRLGGDGDMDFRARPPQAQPAQATTAAALALSSAPMSWPCRRPSISPAASPGPASSHFIFRHFWSAWC